MKILDITTRQNKETCSVIVGSSQQCKLQIQNRQLVSFFSLQIAFSITHITHVLHTTNTCFNCFVLAWIVCFLNTTDINFSPFSIPDVTELKISRYTGTIYMLVLVLFALQHIGKFKISLYSLPAQESMELDVQESAG